MPKAMMKLYWIPASPFTRKVCVSARELGLRNQIEVIPTKWTLDWAYNTINFTQGLAEQILLAASQRW
jgi:hypothetical protein